MDDEAKFSKRANLLNRANTLVDLKLDYNTRSPLRESDRGNKQLVDKFYFLDLRTLTIHLSLITAPASGVNELFELKSFCARHGRRVRHFQKLSKMLDCFQTIMNEIDSIEFFLLRIEGFSAPFLLNENFKKWNVRFLRFSVLCDPVVVTDIVKQFEPECLELVRLLSLRLYEEDSEKDQNPTTLAVSGLVHSWKKILRETIQFEIRIFNDALEESSNFSF